MAHTLFSNREYQNMVRLYIICNHSSPRAAQMYRRIYPNHRQPDRRVFQRAFDRFEQTGNVAVPRRERVGIVFDLADDVIEALSIDPTLSTRRLALRFNSSRRVIHQIIRDEGESTHIVQLANYFG